jgi:hypothetical protein
VVVIVTLPFVGIVVVAAAGAAIIDAVMIVNVNGVAAAMTWPSLPNC